MDTKGTLKIENVEIDIPFGILAAVMNESNRKISTTNCWVVKTKDNSHCNPEKDEFSLIKVSTYSHVHGSYLTVQFDHLRLYHSNGNHVCFLYDCVPQEDPYKTLAPDPPDGLFKSLSSGPACTSVTVDNGMQTDPVEASPKEGAPLDNVYQPEVMPQKRKRGRPRLNKGGDRKRDTNTTNSNNLNTNLESDIHSGYPQAMKGDSTSDNFDTKEAGTSKVLNDLVDATQQILNISTKVNKLNNQSRRYGLRGVKLNTQMMNAVKGLDCSIAEDGNESINQQDIESELSNNDSEYVREKEDDLDEKSEESDSYDEKSGLKRKKDESLKENITSGGICLVDKKVTKKRKPGVIACKICNKLLCDYTGVHNHVVRRHSRRKNISEYLEELKRLKVVQCEICKIEFSDSLKLRQHMDIKHGKTEPVQCRECGKSFKNMQSWRSHVRAMHQSDQGKINVCHLCPASFRAVSNLNQHIKQIHLKKREFTCKICSKKFFNKPLLKRHLRTHGLDESKRVFCEICNKSFLFEFNLKRHRESVHAQQSDKFHCSYCGKGFKNKIGMIAHVQSVHFNLFAYSCKECSASFPRSTMLRTHMISYHEKPDFELPEPLSRNGVYDRTTENMFYCSYCGSAFKHKAKLIEHMHTDHADAFPHKCSICNQGFLEKSFLSVHNLRAHDLVEMDNENEQGHKTGTDESGNIMKLIATKAGCPSKIVAVQSEQSLSSETCGTEVQILSFCRTLGS